MDAIAIAPVLLVVLFAFLGLGVWVAISLLAVGFVALAGFTNTPPGLILANQVWSNMASWTLTALPLFIWMGEILFRSRVSSDLFKGLSPWLHWFPGQLLHVNVVGSGIFAAFSGSSSATCAMVGKVSLPELEHRNYPLKLAIGSLAGSSTLGLLIPPSIIMIVYGVASDVSIARLFVAGILPGLMLMAIFSSYIAIWSLTHRDSLPRETERTTLVERLVLGRHMLPAISLIVIVIGSIYGGIATPTEAAALGVMGALALAALSGLLSWSAFWDGLMGAMLTSTMILFIVAGAAFLTAGLGFTGVPRAIVIWVSSMEVSATGLLIILTLVFLVLGCFIDGISIVVLTAAVLLPVVQAAGIDLLWFGIYLVLVVELSMITPPVGFNLFILQGLTGLPIGKIAMATMPFFLLMILAVALLILFPQIVTFLPSLM
ncbi:TRAP transporter large permease subunit [Sedimentitalea sp.]|uniref:TRAP transporter large permease n=1 Tax=Sedimentitalea sp. TaxID=2048915 RepID=UPI003298EE43